MKSIEHKTKSSRKREIDILIGSKSRVDVLWIFLNNPDEWIGVRELERATKDSYTAVRQAVSDLVKLKLVIEQEKYLIGSKNKEVAVREKRKPYKLNREHPWIPALRMLLEQSIGSVAVVAEAISKVENIDVAFIFGSYATSEQEADSDIDLMLIGEQTTMSMIDIISDLEKRLNVEINIMTYSPDELRDKFVAKHHFVTSVLESPKIFIIGDNARLEEIVMRKKDAAKKVIAG